MGNGTNHFAWLSTVEVQAECDLRRCGWRLTDHVGGSGRDCVVIADFARMLGGQWIGLLGLHEEKARQSILLYGVSQAGERARYLALGFGDVVAGDIGIEETEARATRILRTARLLPGRRDLGGLMLDLMARDAIVCGRRAGLHPREFALLWRLAETPGVSIGKRQLLADVWQTRHLPDTNSLAVHIFRLRAKLSVAGLNGAIRTTADGGYRLELDAVETVTHGAAMDAPASLLSTAPGGLG